MSSLGSVKYGLKTVWVKVSLGFVFLGYGILGYGKSGICHSGKRPSTHRDTIIQEISELALIVR